MPVARRWARRSPRGGLCRHKERAGARIVPLVGVRAFAHAVLPDGILLAV
jgi:hypothetical protein